MSEYSDQERQEFYAKVKEILNEPVTSREQADSNTQLEYLITKTVLRPLKLTQSREITILIICRKYIISYLMGFKILLGNKDTLIFIKQYPHQRGKRKSGTS